MLAALRASGQTLAEACADLSFYPQKLINVRIPAGFDWRQDPAIREAEAAAIAELGQDGRVLLRPSGTEPLLRVMVEGKDGGQVQSLAQRLAEVVAEAANNGA